MRFPVAWVTATTFGMAGYLIAAVIAVPLFRWHWVFLPAAIVSAVAVYGTSTWLGTLAGRRSHGLTLSILLGVSVALATLVAGITAFGLANVLLSWLEEAASLNLGLGPYYSVWRALRDYVLSPLFAVPYVGGWIAVVLGVAYGMRLYFLGKAKRLHFV